MFVYVFCAEVEWNCCLTMAYGGEEKDLYIRYIQHLDPDHLDMGPMGDHLASRLSPLV